MTEEEMLRELDATSAEHQPPVEDYDPSHKQARKAAASAPYKDLPPDAQEGRSSDPHSPAHKSWAKRLEQEMLGFKQGITDPIVGVRQAYKHAAGTPEEAKQADKDVDAREAAYQKASGKGGGIGRFAGNVVTGVPTFLLGDVGAAGAAGIGLAEALMQPISNRKPDDNFAIEKAEQGAVGAAMGATAPVAQTTQKALARGGLFPRSGLDAVQKAKDALPSAIGDRLPNPGKWKSKEEYAAEATKNRRSWRDAGVENPEVGQISEGGLTAHDRPSEKIVKTQYGQMQGRFNQSMDKLYPIDKDFEHAGDVYRRGIEGVTDSKGNVIEEGWVQRTQKKVDDAYKKLDRWLPSDTPADVTPIVKQYEKLTKIDPRKPNQSARDIPAAYHEALDLLKADLAEVGTKKGTSLEFGALKDSRTRLMDKISDLSLTAPQLAKQFNSVVGAYTKALGDAAAKKGKRASAAWEEANSAHMDKVDTYDTFIKPSLSKGSPEETLLEATKGTGKGATYLRATLDNLKPAERKAVQASLIHNMALYDGKPDLIKFSREWQGLKPTVKEALLMNTGSWLHRSLNAIAEHAAKIDPKKVQSIWAERNEAAHNPALGPWYVAALLTGYHTTADVLMTALTAGKFSGHKLTNPRLMKWIADTSDKSGPAAVTAIANLREENRRLPPDQREDVADYLEALGDKK